MASVPPISAWARKAAGLHPIKPGEAGCTFFRDFVPWQTDPPELAFHPRCVPHATIAFVQRFGDGLYFAQRGMRETPVPITPVRASHPDERPIILIILM